MMLILTERRDAVDERHKYGRQLLIWTANYTNMALTVTGDGDAIEITIDFTMPVATSTDSLVLALELDAGGEGTATSDDLVLPHAEGMVRVMASMAPDKVDTIDAASEYFTPNFIPAGGAVAFTIDPARCTLLYPYVTYNLTS